MKKNQVARSEIFVWIGSAGIFLSAALGILAVLFPSSWLIIASLALGGISAPAAILSARYAAREQQKLFEQEQLARQKALEAERREREAQDKNEATERSYLRWSLLIVEAIGIVLAPSIKNRVNTWMDRLTKPQR